MKEVSPQEAANAIFHVRPTEDGRFAVIIDSITPPLPGPIPAPSGMRTFATEAEANDSIGWMAMQVAAAIAADRERSRWHEGDAIYAVYLDAFTSGKPVDRLHPHADDLRAAVALGIAHRNGGGESVMEGSASAFDRPSLAVPRLASKSEVQRSVAKLCGATFKPAETKIEVTLDGKPLTPPAGTAPPLAILVQGGTLSDAEMAKVWEWFVAPGTRPDDVLMVDGKTITLVKHNKGLQKVSVVPAPPTESAPTA